MRIAFISHVSLNLYRFRAPVIRLLAESGHEPFAFVPDHDHDEGLAALGARVVHFPMARGSMNPTTLPAPIRALADCVRRHAPDVVHSFTHQPNIITRYAMRDLGKNRPMVINSVTGLGSCFLGSGLKGAAMKLLFKLLYRHTARQCDAVIFQNRDDRAFFSKAEMLRGAQAHLIRGSGVDVDTFRPDALSPQERSAVRSEFGFKDEDVVFTLTARLIADKGVHEFLDAAQRVRATLPQSAFLLVGETDPANPASFTQDEIQRLADEAGATLAGWRGDMERVWAASDVAVLPSYREGLPVSLQEALAAGLPVVTTDVPGCREIATDGRSGGHCLLVPARNADALGQAMLEFGRDAERRRAAAEAARSKALAEFDGRVIARSHLALYESLLENA